MSNKKIIKIYDCTNMDDAKHLIGKEVIHGDTMLEIYDDQDTAILESLEGDEFNLKLSEDDPEYYNHPFYIAEFEDI